MDRVWKFCHSHYEHSICREKEIKKKLRINYGVQYGYLRIVKVPDKQYDSGWKIKKQDLNS